jgi:indolepyruvate ferredoxin oxidoreductase, alpha subunit
MRRSPHFGFILGFEGAYLMGQRVLVSGDEAVALAALDFGIAFGAGYPGTPSTEILEYFSHLGGHAEWAPNEKVAFEVALGAAFGSARALVTMKHVGLNVAADPLFTAAYTGVSAALVVVSADDPGMASSQNEQDNRRYAEAAGLPMLEPSDSQDAYDYFARAIEISEHWHIPVLFRMTTRVCHSKTILERCQGGMEKIVNPATFHHARQALVMVPANARPAHLRLRKKLTEMGTWNESSSLNTIYPGRNDLGIITSGVSYVHAREAAPEASFLKLGMTHPLPIEKVRAFAQSVERCVVIEEGDPILVSALRAEGINVEGKAEMYRFGELDVTRASRILSGDLSPETAALPGKAPLLCPGCPHQRVFEILRDMDCIVSGDIGCYTLGVLPPFNAMDTCVCMGASIGVGLGLRHVLPDAQARRVVSVIGDSTFVHSGLTGLAEMVYNPPKTGHILLILDNNTTAMTGLQDHPGTGRTLGGETSHKLGFEEIARAMGIPNIHTLKGGHTAGDLEVLLTQTQAKNELTLIVVRNPCLLSAKRDSQRSRKQAGKE